uniref:Uncharacterized protein n=1 Tax=viral metagenome TaxID=1070528 RepID=A0A6M3L9X8_9ZZZZ
MDKNPFDDFEGELKIPEETPQTMALINSKAWSQIIKFLKKDIDTAGEIVYNLTKKYEITKSIEDVKKAHEASKTFITMLQTNAAAHFALFIGLETTDPQLREKHLNSFMNGIEETVHKYFKQIYPGGGL